MMTSDPCQDEKTLIGFLGTAGYKEARYHFPDDSEFETDIFTKAVHEHLKPDKTLMLMTKEAYDTNGLKLLESMDYEYKEIPEVRSQNDIWSIFDIISRAVSANSTLYLDVTYGFRSQPLVGLVSLILVRQIYRVNIQGIYYAAFESRQNNEPVPVFEVSDLLDVIDWSYATGNFLQFGNFDLLSALLSNAQDRMYRSGEKSGNNDYTETHKIRSAKRVGHTLKKLSAAVGISDLKQIEAYSEKYLKDSVGLKDEVQLTMSLKPLELLLPMIDSEIKKISGSSPGNSDQHSVLNQLSIVEWCFSTSRFQQGVTILRELILTSVMLILGKNTNSVDVRENISKALGSYIYDNEGKGFYENPDIDKFQVAELMKTVGLRDIFARISQLRNAMNHAGVGDRNSINIMTLTSDLETLLDSAKSIISQLPLNEERS